MDAERGLEIARMAREAETKRADGLGAALRECRRQWEADTKRHLDVQAEIATLVNQALGDASPVASPIEKVRALVEAHAQLAAEMAEARKTVEVLTKERDKALATFDRAVTRAITAEKERAYVKQMRPAGPLTPMEERFR